MIILSIILITFCQCQQTLKFNQDGKLKILQLTDLHFGETEEFDQKNINLIKNLIKTENPDFVAVTGDVVSGFAWDARTSPWFPQQYQKLGQTLYNLSIPWGLIAGNHDEESDMTSEEVLQVDMLYSPYSMTKQNTQNMSHHFNYILPIHSNNSDTIIARLWFLGTGREDCLGVDGYDCILPEQIAWFKQESRKIQSFKNGIAFIHIPLPEMMYMHNQYNTYGIKGDNIGCWSLNTGFFQSLKQEGTVQWVTMGHDHNNDYWGDYEGITLSYGRKTGYGCYGPKYLKNGARVFELTQDPFQIKTWIRQDDMSIDNQTQVNQPSKFPWMNPSYCSYAETRNQQIVNNIQDQKVKQEVEKRLRV